MQDAAEMGFIILCLCLAIFLVTQCQKQQELDVQMKACIEKADKPEQCAFLKEK